MIRPTTSLVPFTLAAALLSALPAQAQGRTEAGATQTLAESLFDEGRRLAAAGDHAAACPKLAESHRLDPGGGTSLNLALCLERTGRTASAWTAFKEALGLAVHDKREQREQLARVHIARLERMLARVTVVTAPDAVLAGLSVKLDGAELGAAAWGVPTPLDPGEHLLVAEAPGHARWSRTLVIGRERSEALVEVPRLVPSPAHVAGLDAPAGADSRPPERDELPPRARAASRRPWAWAALATGAAAVATGTVLAFAAAGSRSASDRYCSDGTCAAGSPGVDLNETATTFSWASTGAFVLGGAALAASGFLFFTEPDRRPSGRVAVVPALGPSGGSMTFTRSW